jgi:hypothetical protein
VEVSRTGNFCSLLRHENPFDFRAINAYFALAVTPRTWSTAGTSDLHRTASFTSAKAEVSKSRLPAGPMGNVSLLTYAFGHFRVTRVRSELGILDFDTSPGRSKNNCVYIKARPRVRCFHIGLIEPNRSTRSARAKRIHADKYRSSHARSFG